MRIDGRTTLYGLIGSPVAHSISPQLHNGYMKTHDVSGVYLAFDLQAEDLPAALSGFRTLQIGGLNVTSPHKERVIPLLDEVRGDAARLESVNTIKREGNRLIGFNTDTLGIKTLIASHGLSVENRTVALLGSGGAAKSALLALLQLGAGEVRVFSRTREKRDAMLGRFAGEPVRGLDLATFGEHSGEIDLLVNATPVGMGTLVDRTPVSVEGLKSTAAVVDLIYHPERTRLLIEASERGHVVANGLHMLVGQAVAAMGIWLDREVPLTDYLEFL